MTTTPRDSRASSFPSTCWSRVLGRDPRGEIPTDLAKHEARPDLEGLLRAYWRPVHAYLRAKHRLSPEDALDATQDFFVRILEGELLPRADPRRGRFRGYLKTAIDHAIVDRARAAQAAKRGGGRRLVPLSLPPNDPGSESDSMIPGAEPADPRASRPDEVLDSRWRACLVEGALDDVRRELESAGKKQAFEIFHAYYVANEPVDHAALAKRHGIAVTDVSNRLRDVKQRYRRSLRHRIRETVDTEDDYRVELEWMFGREDTPSR